MLIILAQAIVCIHIMMEFLSVALCLHHGKLTKSMRSLPSASFVTARATERRNGIPHPIAILFKRSVMSNPMSTYMVAVYMACALSTSHAAAATTEN